MFFNANFITAVQLGPISKVLLILLGEKAYEQWEEGFLLDTFPQGPEYVNKHVQNLRLGTQRILSKFQERWLKV